jgi:hypothetical protein
MDRRRTDMSKRLYDLVYICEIVQDYCCLGILGEEFLSNDAESCGEVQLSPYIPAES